MRHSGGAGARGRRERGLGWRGADIGRPRVGFGLCCAVYDYFYLASFRLVRAIDAYLIGRQVGMFTTPESSACVHDKRELATRG